jgi:hypothetical protein
LFPDIDLRWLFRAPFRSLQSSTVLHSRKGATHASPQLPAPQGKKPGCRASRW